MKNKTSNIINIQTPAGIGTYGRRRLRYLREHRPDEFAELARVGQLQAHLWEIDEAAQHYLDTMDPRMAAAAGVTEELKARDQMKWIGMMNTIRAQVDEIIRADLIYG